MKSRIITGFVMALWATASLANAETLLDRKDVPGDFSSNLAFTTEYFFRGISQADDGVPSVQGGLDYTHPSGVYVGIWGSNVKFTDASVELDYFGGIKGEVGKLGWDVGALYYHYPGADGSLNYDFFEVYGGLGYDFGLAAANFQVNYSPDYFGSSGDAYYFNLGIDAPIGKYLTLNLHTGYQTIDDNAVFGSPDYIDFLVGLTADVLGFDLQLAYIGTDMSDTECPDACDQVVFTLSTGF